MRFPCLLLFGISLLNLGCSGSPGPTPSQPTVKSEKSQNDEFATQMLAAINTERTANGCQPLVWNAALEKAAQDHTAWMHENEILSHKGAGGSTFSKRLEDAGYKQWTTCAENVAMGQTSISQVMTTWMNSHGHRANILNKKILEVGAARVGNYWTQDFGARREN